MITEDQIIEKYLEGHGKEFIDDGYTLTAIYEYQDESGTVIQYKSRFDNPCSGKDKAIRYFWINKTFIIPLKKKAIKLMPLYKLPGLLKNLNDVVYIVEGEACADRLAELGMTVTTSGGATGYSKTDWKPLAGRQVVIWPDNDEAGLKYAEAVTKILMELECSIQWVDLAQFK